MQNNEEEFPFSMKNYIKEIKENIRAFQTKQNKDKKSSIGKISQIHKRLQNMKKQIVLNQPIWEDSKIKFNQTILNDVRYQNFLLKGKLIQERIKTCIISNDINFSICPSTKAKSIYDEKFSNEMAKKFYKTLKINSKPKNKKIIVNECDYSFSDNSIDCSITPIVF